MTISSTQVVGQTFITEARIILLDSNSVQLTEFDLSTHPLSLVSSIGEIVPGVLDDPALFNGGVIDLRPAGVRYLGPTGNVEIYVTDGLISSSVVIVSFNGYDILNAFDFIGNPISQIYSDLPTTIHVTVQNRGTREANSEPTIKAYFRSGGGSIKYIFYAPQANGIIDTLPIQLETPNLNPGEDTMVLELTSEYLVNEILLEAFTEYHIPVTVYALASFDVVPGSFLPDTVYQGVPFEVSFDVAATDFPGQIDSTSLTIKLCDSINGAELATIYTGSPSYHSFSGGVISYDSLTAEIDTLAGLTPGPYMVKLDYHLISGGNIFTLDNAYPDSIQLLAPASLTYAAGSLEPLEINAGSDVPFRFDLILTGVPALEIDPDLSVFTLSGQGYSATVNLSVADNMLNEGVNTVVTDPIFIPLDQVGASLKMSTSIHYRQTGAANYIEYETNFNGQEVTVLERPTVQILELRALMPNRPRINVGQAFQLLCRIANQSEYPVTGMTLNLTSNGTSVFNSEQIVDEILPLDTVEILYDITAAEETNSNEVLQVEIVSNNLNQLEPLDDIELIVIEEPALLLLSYNSQGLSDGIIEPGDTVYLTVNLTNYGQAETTIGRYRFSTGGVEMGIPDPFEGNIVVGVPLRFTLVGPEIDTVTFFTFDIIQKPTELNTSLPAEIGDTAFDIGVTLASLDAELFVRPEKSDHLIAAGNLVNLFYLDLTNTGTSSLTDMLLEHIAVTLSDAQGQPLAVRSVLEVGNSGFYEDNEQVTTAVAGQNKITLYFSDFIIPASQTRTIYFKAMLVETLPETFTVNLDKYVVNARFIDAIMAGDNVAVSSPTGDSTLLSELYVTSGKSLEQSFRIENNPFNPYDAPASFRYYLEQESRVEFRIFTLIGEEVFSLDIPAGEGLVDDLNEITWDGRNNDGDLVYNGVYIAQITIHATGQEARLKVAVMK
ncbi:MAG: hypothetical protein ACOYVF_14660 [Candidatus Zixiibacteriota bacterium]